MIDVDVTQYVHELKYLVSQLEGLQPVTLIASRDAMKTLRLLTIGRTPVGEVKKKKGKRKGSKKYVPGTAKKSWTDVEASGEEVKFSLTVPYAGPLEFGSFPTRPPWPNVGPRTTKFHGMIFSRQAPGGMAGPILEDESLSGDQIFGKILDRITRSLS
jgi:hypothetical protein